MDKQVNIKAIVTVKISQDEMSSPNLVRKIHQKVPRKFITSSIIDTAVKNDEAYVTMDLTPAPMVSIDELKSYLQMKGENARLKSFIKWLENLEKSYNK